MECEIPTINETDENIIKILNECKNIAVIGLSPDMKKDSNKVAKYMQEQGYKIIPVYPKGDTILGEKVYRNLSEIDIKVDLVNIFRKSQIVSSIVDEALKRNDIKAVWAQKQIINNEAMQKAKSNALYAVQNKCLMIEHMNLKNKS